MAERIHRHDRTFKSYRDWWKKYGPPIPSAYQGDLDGYIRRRYAEYCARRGVKPVWDTAPKPWEPIPNKVWDDAQQRVAEYEYTDRLAVHHRDGDPTNNDLSNLIAVAGHEAVLQNNALFQYVKETGRVADSRTWFTIEDGMKMNAKIARVFFGGGDYIEGVTTTYDYLTKDIIEVLEGQKLFVVVPKGDVKVNDSNSIAIAQVHKIVDVTEAKVDKLKWIVAAFNVDAYNERIAKKLERERLIKQATKLAEDKSSIEKLTKLLADDEVGKALLAKIAELDNE